RRGAVCSVDLRRVHAQHDRPYPARAAVPRDLRVSGVPVPEHRRKAVAEAGGSFYSRLGYSTNEQGNTAMDRLRADPGARYLIVAAGITAAGCFTTRKRRSVSCPDCATLRDSNWTRAMLGWSK